MTFHSAYNQLGLRRKSRRRVFNGLALTLASFNSCRQHRLKVRTAQFSRNNLYFVFLESGLLQQMKKFDLAEPEPKICV